MRLVRCRARLATCMATFNGGGGNLFGPLGNAKTKLREILDSSKERNYHFSRLKNKKDEVWNGNGVSYVRLKAGPSP